MARGRAPPVVHGVIVGTGVGSGVVVHGRVLDGANAIAGEWGHNPLPWPRDDERPGPSCYCGRRGCIETWLSGPGMERDHFETTGERRAAKEIAARAAAGDADSEATLARLEERFARAIAHVINLLDPDVIVLGGGMSNIDRLYTNVPRQWGGVGVLGPRRHPAHAQRARRLEWCARGGMAVGRHPRLNARWTARFGSCSIS
jgi:fructokinase